MGTTGTQTGEQKKLLFLPTCLRLPSSPTPTSMEPHGLRGEPVEISIRFRSLGSMPTLPQQGSQQLRQAEGGAVPPTLSAWLAAMQGSPGAPGALPPSLAQFLAQSRAAGAASAGASGSEASLERVHRLSGAVAGSIFSDLINGALRPGEVGPPPASERAISELPCCEPPTTDTQCSVCLCDIESDATRMPCGHYHHTACLTKWLRSHNTCPVCRSTVEADESPRPSSLSALLQGWRGGRSRGEGSGEGSPEPMVLRTTAPSVAEAPSPPSEAEVRAGRTRAHRTTTSACPPRPVSQGQPISLFPTCARPALTCLRTCRCPLS